MRLYSPMRDLFHSLFGASGDAAADIPELNSTEECMPLFDLDLVVIFKHSPSCFTSVTAHRQVARFQHAHPQVPIRLILVRRRREVSNYVAERFQLEHASPQALVLRRGKLVATASHDAVTAEFLSEAIRSALTDQISENLSTYR